jgi:hypothetical protein
MIRSFFSVSFLSLSLNRQRITANESLKHPWLNLNENDSLPLTTNGTDNQIK